MPDYYGCCRRLDENFGRVLDILERKGIDDETIVLFTSDHGCHFRTRNREYKRSAHESSIRIPAVFQGPGFDGGGTIEEVTSLLDVPATLLEAAGVEVPDSFQGESVRPLVGGRDGSNEAWRNDTLVQISESAVERALRTDRWTYSVYDPDADPIDDPASPDDTYVERYLYDLRADPHQTVNLAGREDYREIADGLRDRIQEYEGRAVEIREADYPA